MNDIQQTIDDIITAEKKADLIIDQASKKSKEILMEATAKVAEIKRQSELAIKTSVKDIMAEGDKRANEEYEAIVSKGKIAAEALQKKAEGNIDKVSDVIVKAFIEGVKVNYGNN